MRDKTQLADWHYQRGVVLEQAGRIAEAVEEYRQALQDNPRLRAAHVALAQYYARNGLLAKSADAWAAALAVDQDYEGLAFYAHTLIELQRYPQARQTLDLCLLWAPDDLFANYEYAFLDFLEERYQQAAERLLSLRPIYNDEWQIHHLLGNCQYRLGELDAALASFGRASLLTNDADHLDELQESIVMVERRREFDQPELSLKERLYVEHGVVCLGTSDDNGIDIPAHATLEWSYQQLAMTLARTAALVTSGLIPATVVAPFDRAATPLAEALAARLRLPCLVAEKLPRYGTALIVGHALADGSMLAALDERVACRSLVLMLTLLREPKPDDVLPDLVGVQATLSRLPWAADLAAARLGPEPGPAGAAVLAAARTELAKALAKIRPSGIGADQVSWYARHRHILAFGD